MCKITTKAKIIGSIYRNILKKIYFKLDPEKVHDGMTNLGIFVGNYKITKKITSSLFNYSDPALEQDILGIKFKNPIGLAAGFDKDAELTNILPYVGFGFEEVGSITGEPCDGNPKPRLWRMPKSQSIVVYYGLKNRGSEILSNNLKNKKFDFPIGVSIAKTNCKETVDLDKGVADYVKAYKNLIDIGSYVTINISCPNAFGGQPFTDKASFEKLLQEISKLEKNKPIFVKLSPDLSMSEIDDLIDTSEKYNIDGFICGNLTKSRENKRILDEKIPEKGGFSGKIVENLSNELIKHVYKKTNGKKIIIGCGGIFTAEDAYKKIKLGASLLQMITGMIYNGPQVIGEINYNLAELVKKDGYKNISEAIGVENK